MPISICIYEYVHSLYTLCIYKYMYSHSIFIVVSIMYLKLQLLALFIVITIVCACVPGPMGGAVVYHVKVVLFLAGRGVT